VTTKTLENGEGKDYGKAASWFQKAAGTGCCELEETGQGQDISCNDQGRQGRGGARLRKNIPLWLFYFGSVLKADDLDGSLSLVDAIVEQVISVD
jgi:hypothetical protein